MQTLRKKSLFKLSSASEEVPMTTANSLDFGAHVFDIPKLKQFLSEKAFKQMLQSIDKGIPINLVLADLIQKHLFLVKYFNIEIQIMI